MTYHAKLLLLGEHTINRGSDALAIPFPTLGGAWRSAEADPSFTRAHQQDLAAFAAYLTGLRSRGELLAPLDPARFAADLRAGLYFDSNIPTGYGLGSSGALCAAVYERYASAPIGREQTGAYGDLRRQLAQMESFFHGASSGTDPLICYLDRPILLRSDGRIEPAALPPWPAGEAPYHFFLLDTGIPRKTGPLVELFLRKCADPAFAEPLRQRLIPRTNKAIEHLLAGRWPALFDDIDIISRFQFAHLPELIPAPFHPLWAAGLDGDRFRLKLCGAGGGGFILGYASDLDGSRVFFRENGVDLVVVGEE